MQALDANGNANGSTPLGLQYHQSVPRSTKHQQPFPSAGSGGPSPGPETPLPLLQPHRISVRNPFISPAPHPPYLPPPHNPSPPIPSSGRASTRRGAKGSHGVGTEVDEDGEDTLRGDGDDSDSDREARDSLKWLDGER